MFCNGCVTTKYVFFCEKLTCGLDVTTGRFSLCSTFRQKHFKCMYCLLLGTMFQNMRSKVYKVCVFFFFFLLFLFLVCGCHTCKCEVKNNQSICVCVIYALTYYFYSIVYLDCKYLLKSHKIVK